MYQCKYCGKELRGEIIRKNIYVNGYIRTYSFCCEECATHYQMGAEG